MKIALVIFPIHPSHGCILQTYALQQVLMHEGHDVTIIDRQWNKPSILTKAKERLKIIIKMLSGKPAYSRYAVKKTLMSELSSFVDANLQNRRIFYCSPSYEEYNDIDAFIVGSDQNWRPEYVSDVTHYFLSFVPQQTRVKRIAYAPSFGTEEWTYSEQLTDICKKLLQRFDAISVREETGIRLCKEYFNIDAVHVLDPTLLLDKTDYLKVTELKLEDEDLLSYYLLDSSDSKMSIINVICKTMKLTAQRINNDTDNNKAPLRERIAPSIKKWIGGFAHSKFIVTDSFHATAFAILFNKPFIVIANPDRGQARFESLLGKLGLINRMVFSSDYLTVELLHKPIDWKTVNKTLNEERNMSMKFILNALQPSDS